jgi:hypothetical protein
VPVPKRLTIISQLQPIVKHYFSELKIFSRQAWFCLKSSSIVWDILRLSSRTSFLDWAGKQEKGAQQMVSIGYILLPCPNGGDLDDMIYSGAEGPLVSQR